MWYFYCSFNFVQQIQDCKWLLLSLSQELEFLFLGIQSFTYIESVFSQLWTIDRYLRVLL